VCIMLAQGRLWGVYQYGTVEMVWGVSGWHSGNCVGVYQAGTVEIVWGCIRLAQWRLYGVYQYGTVEIVGIRYKASR